MKRYPSQFQPSVPLPLVMDEKAPPDMVLNILPLIIDEEVPPDEVMDFFSMNVQDNVLTLVRRPRSKDRP